MSNVTEFIKEISIPQIPNMYNPWSQLCETEIDIEGDVARRQRLKLHLECPEPRIVLIGEAPGYQGCRYTGLAFTSERLLLENEVPRMPDLKGKRITNRKTPWSEPSATVVWGALHQYGLAEHAVLFNAVPWHPIGTKGKHSNRTPTKSEKDLGLKYLDMFLQLYKDVPIAAIGNTASDNLKRLDILHEKLRHPAYGGAQIFREGLKKWV